MLHVNNKYFISIKNVNKILVNSAETNTFTFYLRTMDFLFFAYVKIFAQNLKYSPNKNDIRHP